jgi:hypothetical protein
MPLCSPHVSFVSSQLPVPKTGSSVAARLGWRATTRWPGRRAKRGHPNSAEAPAERRPTGMELDRNMQSFPDVSNELLPRAVVSVWYRAPHPALGRGNRLPARWDNSMGNGRSPHRACRVSRMVNQCQADFSLGRAGLRATAIGARAGRSDRSRCSRRPWPVGWPRENSGQPLPGRGHRIRT